MDKILENVKVTQSGCWIWLRSCSSSGYGQLSVDGKYWTAHRYSYTQSKGPVPEGLVVRHLCGEPKCCNPAHLIAGTQKENYSDSKEAYLKAQSLRRKVWVVGGTKFDTLRQASEILGIPQATLVKYTSDSGVFNVEMYRKGCKKANRVARI